MDVGVQVPPRAQIMTPTVAGWGFCFTTPTRVSACRGTHNPPPHGGNHPCLLLSTPISSPAAAWAASLTHYWDDITHYQATTGNLHYWMVSNNSIVYKLMDYFIEFRVRMPTGRIGRIAALPGYRGHIPQHYQHWNAHHHGKPRARLLLQQPGRMLHFPTIPRNSTRARPD